MQALQLRGHDASLLHALQDEDWRQLLPMLDRARLTLPLAQKAPSGLPGWVRERLSCNLADAARSWERVQTAYREAAAALDGKGVEFLVLKGFTQAPEYVPSPKLRRQWDIDLYVPRDQIASAVRGLQEIGYASCRAEEVYRHADHVPTLVRFGTWKWRGNWYDPDTPPAIELHFCLWNDSVSSIAIPEVNEFWIRRRVRACEDLIFPALHPVDHLAYFALHILRDIFNEDSRANQVQELAISLDRRAGDDAFWKEWTATHSRRSRSMQATVFSLAVAWFSCCVSDTVKSEIRSLPPRVGAWIKRCGCTPLEAQFRRTRDGRLLQTLFAETPEARKKILWRVVLPERVPGPAKIASCRTHPSLPEAPKLISSYLAYPAYIASRAWLNGGAILRFVAHASLVLASRVRVRPVSRSDFESAPGI
ncbi:MAG TPA: nucleotidyltransferase family protein [Terracidiphilus sp.]|nr:nucleotidyltransferase family protein [Terracidiphilus sp.]